MTFLGNSEWALHSFCPSTVIFQKLSRIAFLSCTNCKAFWWLWVVLGVAGYAVTRTALFRSIVPVGLRPVDVSVETEAHRVESDS